jgi:hypothetical protein
MDNPGSIAEHTIYGFGTDSERLYAVSPTYHARVFEGQRRIQILLRLGGSRDPATAVVGDWLQVRVPVT